LIYQGNVTGETENYPSLQDHGLYIIVQETQSVKIIK